MNIGAGRVVYQDLTRIDKSIRDGEFFETRRRCSRRWIAAPAATHALHLIGLLSDGGVHSHQRHLHALIELAERGAACARLRPRHHRRPRHLADRRHAATSPRSRTHAPRRRRPHRDGLGPLLRDGSRQALGAHQARLRRDRARRRADDARPRDAGDRGGLRGRRDRRVHQADRRSSTPTAQPVGPIRDGDAVIFFNFRADRTRQITRALALRRLRRLRPRPRSPRVALDDDDGVRPRRSRCRSSSRRRPASGIPRGRARRARPDQPAARRDREVRARHLLLQRRPRGAVPGRRPHAGALAEGARPTI